MIQQAPEKENQENKVDVRPFVLYNSKMAIDPAVYIVVPLWTRREIFDLNPELSSSLSAHEATARCS